jgi:hypothetical protein
VDRDRERTEHFTAGRPGGGGSDQHPGVGSCPPATTVRFPVTVGFGEWRPVVRRRRSIARMSDSIFLVGHDGSLAGQDAPEPPGDEPAGVRHGRHGDGEAGQGQHGPGEGNRDGQPPQRDGGRGEDGQFGAPSPGRARSGAVEAAELFIGEVGIVPLVAASAGVRGHGGYRLPAWLG